MREEPSAVRGVMECAVPERRGTERVVIEHVSPQVDGWRFPSKRVIGESVSVRADIFTDGHDALSAVIKYRHDHEASWSENLMEPGINDVWEGSFMVTQAGCYIFTIEAWVNHFESWRRDLKKKYEAGQDISLDLLSGVPHVQAAAVKAEGQVSGFLQNAVKSLSDNSLTPAARFEIATTPRLAELVQASSRRSAVTNYRPLLRIWVEPPLARFSAWYELFPRSCSTEPGRHGTFKDCQHWLPRIANMGFDIVYLPPIHPIGRSSRKGKNGSLVPTDTDPGSPWAIGSAEGGHKSIHPELGTLDDFRELVRAARELKVHIALDIAFQCSPDHPWVREHPEWFRHRADGSIQYAENPPKKYQDIIPLNFETEAWPALWDELKSVFEFWLEQGVTIFRVDNPHTKSFRFWEWCIAELKSRHPELIFLSEAFTRPKVMYYLAKVGFTQSYNYFPWRNTRHELVSYFTELTQSPVREFFRPNLWPNTPDILTEYLQFGGRPAFMSRLVLAATLGPSYGIYGPSFETCENVPREPGSEEYLNSEKYEIRHWDLERPGTLSELLSRINRIRRENPALHSNDNLKFHETDNDQLIAYSKYDAGSSNLILILVNLDPHHVQRGWLEYFPEQWDISPKDTFQAHELLTDAHYLWTGHRHYVELDPAYVPAHILRLRRYVRREVDFDYFL